MLAIEYYRMLKEKYKNGNLEEELLNNIKENAYIENVSISRKLPSTIVITIEESAFSDCSRLTSIIIPE